MSQFYELKADKPSGGAYDFSDLKGKVALIVNTASQCGMTPQYKGLEELQAKYKEKGFTVIGFPCNQFGGQDPGTDEEIATFCSVNYKVTFPLMKKSDVNGDGTNPVFKYLKDEKTEWGDVKWNFEKFLVDREGKVVERFGSRTTPETIDPEIAKLL